MAEHTTDLRHHGEPAKPATDMRHHGGPAPIMPATAPRDAEIARLREEAQRLVADHEKAKADMVAGDPWLDSLVRDLASFAGRVARLR